MRKEKVSWLTKEQEHELSNRCQKSLHRLRKRLGAAIDEKATPEVVMAAARARRWDVSEIEAARDVLVKKCTPWARNIVRRTYERQISSTAGLMDLDDMTQSAMCGLMSAALRFKSQRAKWSTYCTWWIRQAVGRALRQDSHIIRIPEYLHSEVRQNQLDEAELSRVRKIMYVDLVPVPEYLPDRKHATTPDNTVLHQEMRRLLDKKELEIVLRRFGIGRYPRQTLEVIGESLKLSRERIRQIEKIALSKLRESKLLREELECQ